MRKAFVLAIGLAMQIAPPMPGQQPGASSQSANKQQQERKAADAGSGKSLPIKVPLNAPDAKDEAQGVAGKDKEQSVKLSSLL